MTNKAATKRGMVERIVARASGFDLIAMSNLHPSTTGVAAVIWVSVGEFEGKKVQHGPRIKVVPGNKLNPSLLKEAITVTLENPPRVIGTLLGTLQKQVLGFVEKNRAVLLQHWNHEIDMKGLLDQLQTV
jgi:hypothetical protein